MFKLLILLGSFSFGMSAAIMETNPAWAEEDIEFFVGARSTANNEWQWTSKLEVPLIPDLAAYGYAANVPPNEDITVTDILSLPARIAVVPTNARVSKDGRTVTITKTRRSSSEGRLGSMYIIAPGDPAGSYSLSVLFNGEPVKTFHFQVIYAGTAAPETDVKKLIADLVENDKQKVTGKPVSIPPIRLRPSIHSSPTGKLSHKLIVSSHDTISTQKTGKCACKERKPK